MNKKTKMGAGNYDLETKKEALGDPAIEGKAALKKRAFVFAKILFALFVIIPLVPPLVVYDSSTMRFFFLACVSLLTAAYGLFFCKQNISLLSWRWRKQWLLWIWLPLLLWMSISTSWAINTPESILMFNRWLIVFCTFLSVFTLMRRYPILVSFAIHLFFGIAVLHIFYCLIPYYTEGIHLGKNDITYLNGFHGNKNVFAVFVLFLHSALIYLLFYGSRKWRIAAAVVFFLSAVVVVLLNARASYLSFFGQMGFAFAFAILMGIRRKEFKRWLYKACFVLGIGVGGFMAGTGLLYFNYYCFYVPYAQKHHLAITPTGNSVLLRIQSIGDAGGGARFRIWKNTYKVLNEFPYTGVGAGNFKVAVQKYESPQKGTFLTSDHSHNDFLETCSELGYLGGGFYLIWIFGSGVAMVILMFHRKTKPKELRMVFFSAVIWVAYLGDAIFNFPMDRAECQWMIALSYAGIAVAYLRTFSTGKLLKPRKMPLEGIIAVMCCIIIAIPAGIHYRSSILQRQIVGVKRVNAFGQAAQTWTARFGRLPNIDENGRPIAIQIARIYALEKNYRGAIDALLPDRSNPYLGLREYKLSYYYDKLGEKDSATYWAEACFVLKPLLYPNVSFLSQSYLSSADTLRAMGILQQFLTKQREQSLDPIGYSIDKKDTKKAVAAIKAITKQTRSKTTEKRQS